MKRLIIGMSGASGVIYGIRLLEVLKAMSGVETHLVMSRYARLNIEIETDHTPQEVEALADEVHSYGNQAASISSGSFKTDGMVIAPCSMKTLSGIANSSADSLLVRAPSSQPDKLYDWPHSYRLSQNFPNPFNNETVILFELPQASRVRLEIYNILGQRVRTLLDNVSLERGYHRIHWDGRNLNGTMVSSGVYIYHFWAGAYTKVHKMILVR